MIEDGQPSLIIAVMSQCETCGYIALDNALARTDIPCPVCGARGEIRRVYPDLSVSILLEMMQYFYARAAKAHQDELSIFTTRIREALKREVSEKAVYRGWIEFNRTYLATKDLKDVIERIKLWFKCEGAVATNILQIYMNPRAHAPELTTVPILAVTLVEALLNGLLTDLRIKKHSVSIIDARQEVKELRSFESRYEMFAELTGTSFDVAVQQASMRFWNKWGYVHRKRNLFVHGNPFALGWSVADCAFNLALDGIGVFARLNNLFAVRK